MKVQWQVNRSVDDLQADLGAWIKSYNEEREHQGRLCFGKPGAVQSGLRCGHRHAAGPYGVRRSAPNQSHVLDGTLLGTVFYRSRLTTVAPNVSLRHFTMPSGGGIHATTRVNHMSFDIYDEVGQDNTIPSRSSLNSRKSSSRHVKYRLARLRRAQ